MGGESFLQFFSAEVNVPKSNSFPPSASSWCLTTHEARPPPKETGQRSIFCQLSFHAYVIRRPSDERTMFGVFSTFGIWGGGSSCSVELAVTYSLHKLRTFLFIYSRLQNSTLAFTRPWDLYTAKIKMLMKSLTMLHISTGICLRFSTEINSVLIGL